MKQMNIYTALLLLALATSCFSSHIEVEIAGKLKGSKDISAFSCMDDFHCIVVSDEKNGIQTLEYSNGKLTVTSKLLLIDESQNETDFEAITNDGKYYYISGSHGLSRKKSEYQESRYRVYRILLSKDGVITEIVKSSLTPYIKKSELVGSFKKPLSDDGFNIEGLAFFKGRLIFGLRSPSINSQAQFISVSAQSLFKVNNKEFHSQVTSVKLGRGLGVRSIEIKNDKLYLLEGNSDQNISENIPKLKLFRINDMSLIRTIDLDRPGFKAEGLEIIGDRAIIFFDSQKNGLPISVKL